MVFNDLFILEVLIILVILFYITNSNIIMLLYTAGILLILVGVFAFLNDVDIYIGFLWVIDLGVGLIFFIFIIHFTSFLHQKSFLNLNIRYFFFLYFFLFFIFFFIYFLSLNNDMSNFMDLRKSWFFKIIFLDYYQIYISYEVTELNVLKDTYFLINSFEFFLINFSLLFGLISSIFLLFMLHRIFNLLNFSQIYNFDFLKSIESNFFIRNQNFSHQHFINPHVRYWSKKNNKKIK